MWRLNLESYPWPQRGSSRQYANQYSRGSIYQQTYILRRVDQLSSSTRNNALSTTSTCYSLLGTLSISIWCNSVTQDDHHGRLPTTATPERMLCHVRYELSLHRQRFKKSPELRRLRLNSLEEMNPAPQLTLLRTTTALINTLNQTWICSKCWIIRGKVDLH